MDSIDRAKEIQACIREISQKHEREMKRRIRDFQYEMGASGRLMRARSIEEQLEDIEDALIDRRNRLEKLTFGTAEYELCKKMILALVAQRKKLSREFEYALSILIESVSPKRNQHQGVTDDEIARARTYPIEHLVDVKRNTARCVSGDHEDRHPSMDVRNNFAHCYACGWNGDVIAVYMKLHGGTFVDAVKAMQ